MSPVTSGQLRASLHTARHNIHTFITSPPDQHSLFSPPSLQLPSLSRLPSSLLPHIIRLDTRCGVRLALGAASTAASPRAPGSPCLFGGLSSSHALGCNRLAARCIKWARNSAVVASPCVHFVRLASAIARATSEKKVTLLSYLISLLSHLSRLPTCTHLPKKW